MRKVGILLAGFVTFLLAAHGSAQHIGRAWTGADPRNIQLKPIDTSRAFMPGATDRAIRSATPMRPFTIDRFFPKFNVAPWPPRIANPFQFPKAKK